MVWSGDPSHDWDIHCDIQERAYKALIHGKACKDCAMCETNPDDDSAWGWCRECGEFVALDDLVSDIDCEDYEE